MSQRRAVLNSGKTGVVIGYARYFQELPVNEKTMEVGAWVLIDGKKQPVVRKSIVNWSLLPETVAIINDFSRSSLIRKINGGGRRWGKLISQRTSEGLMFLNLQ